MQTRYDLLYRIMKGQSILYSNDTVTLPVTSFSQVGDIFFALFLLQCI